MWVSGGSMERVMSLEKEVRSPRRRKAEQQPIQASRSRSAVLFSLVAVPRRPRERRGEDPTDDRERAKSFLSRPHCTLKVAWHRPLCVVIQRSLSQNARGDGQHEESETRIESASLGRPRPLLPSRPRGAAEKVQCKVPRLMSTRPRAQMFANCIAERPPKSPSAATRRKVRRSSAIGVRRTSGE